MQGVGDRETGRTKEYMGIFHTFNHFSLCILNFPKCLPINKFKIICYDFDSVTHLEKLFHNKHKYFKKFFVFIFLTFNKILDVQKN